MRNQAQISALLNDTVELIDEIKKKQEDLKKLTISVSGNLNILKNDIGKVKPYARNPNWMKKNQAAEVINNIFETSFDFMPTYKVATYLRAQHPDFANMSNMQIGRILSICDFRSGISKNKRGFYIKAKFA